MRVVFDFVQIVKRDWYPQGIVLIIGTYVYRFTDPPLRFLAHYIPPLRLGGVSFDMGFVVLYFGVSLLRSAISFGMYSLLQ